MKDSSITLKIPLEEKYLPNITAQVDLVGAEPRTNDKGEVDPKLAKRPAFASGNINLAISTASRKLTVSADPVDKTLAPGGETKVNVAGQRLPRRTGCKQRGRDRRRRRERTCPVAIRDRRPDGHVLHGSRDRNDGLSFAEGYSAWKSG